MTNPQPLRVSAADISAAVTWAAAAVASRPPHPSASGVVLSAADGVLTVSGHDWHRMHSARTPMEGTLDPIGVLAPLAKDVFARCKGAVELLLDGPTLRVSDRRAKFRLPVIADPAAWSPVIPDAAGSTKSLAWGAKIAAASASTDETLAVLTGVHMLAEGGRLTLSTTDRYRAARVIVDWQGADFEALPAARDLIDACRSLDGEVMVAANDVMRLSDETRMALLPTIDQGAGNAFPRLDSFFDGPAWDDGATVVADREEVAEAVKTATAVASVAGSKERLVDVQARDGGLWVAAFVQGEPVESEVFVEASRFDGAFTVTLNADYLADALAGTPTDVVRLDLTPQRQVRVVGLDAEGDPIEHVQHMVMTIKKKG